LNPTVKFNCFSQVITHQFIHSFIHSFTFSPAPFIFNQFISIKINRYRNRHVSSMVAKLNWFIKLYQRNPVYIGYAACLCIRYPLPEQFELI